MARLLAARRALPRWARERAPHPWVRTLPPAPRGWWFDLLLVAAFVALTAALVWWPPLLSVDLRVRDWVDGHRPEPVRVLMLIFDRLGQGGPVMTVTLLIGFAFAWRYRSVRPIFPAGLAPILTTASIVPLKRWTERGAPHFGSVEMFSHSTAVEYPSGHVNNGAVYYTTLALLFLPYLSPAARGLVRWAPRFLVLLGTTYLGYHWLTDSIGGLILGTFLARVALRVPWHRIPLPALLEAPAAGLRPRPPPEKHPSGAVDKSTRER